MTIPASRVAAQISEVQRRLQAVERGPQLGNSSVVIDGTDVLVTDALASGLRAEVVAAEAIDAASSASAKADGAIVTFYGDASDRSSAKTGDFWVNDAGQVSIYSATGTWEPVTSALVAEALNAARDAEAAVDGKVTSFYAPAAPTAEAVGDIWFDTDDGNHLYRWDGTTWADVQDEAISAAVDVANAAQNAADSALVSANDARAIADGKVATYFQPTAPTGQTSTDVGDLWFDTDDGNKMYRWTGTTWEVAQDQSIAQAVSTAQQAQSTATSASSTASSAQSAANTAQTTASDALTTANRKVTTFYQPGAPTATATGDLWVDTDDGNRLYRWNGSTWQDARDTTIQAAQNAATQAQARADSALTTAQTAQTTADAKAVTYFQGTAPTGLAAGDVGDLWFDTANGNRMSRWSGTQWVLSQDQSIAAAQNAAAAAQTAAGTAQTTADRKITTYYQTNAPSASTTGDLWVDTDDGNRLYRWSGSAWVDVESARIAAAQQAATAAQNRADTALSTANTAQATADGKVTTYFQTAAPTGLVAGDVGDLWFDTDDANKMYRWSGTAWVLSSDTRISDALTQAQTAQSTASSAQTAASTAQSTADKKITTYYTGTAPTTGLVQGDLWVDTANGNRLARWNGTAWTVVQDSNAAQTAANNAQNAANSASSTANTALTTANGKNKITYGTSLPTGAVEGDLFFYTAGGNAMYRFTAGAWSTNPLGDAALSSLTAGKIVTGTLQSATRIIAGTDGAGRVELSGTGFKAFNGSNVQTVAINTDGSVSITGSLTTGFSGNRVQVASDRITFFNASGGASTAASLTVQDNPNNYAGGPNYGQRVTLDGGRPSTNTAKYATVDLQPGTSGYTLRIETGGASDARMRIYAQDNMDIDSGALLTLGDYYNTNAQGMPTYRALQLASGYYGTGWIHSGNKYGARGAFQFFERHRQTVNFSSSGWADSTVTWETFYPALQVVSCIPSTNGTLFGDFTATCWSHDTTNTTFRVFDSRFTARTGAMSIEVWAVR